MLFVIILFFHPPAQQQPLRSATAPPTRPSADAALCEQPPAPPRPRATQSRAAGWSRAPMRTHEMPFWTTPWAGSWKTLVPHHHLLVPRRESFQAGSPAPRANGAGQRCQDKAGGTRSQQTTLLAMLPQGRQGKPGPGPRSPAYTHGGRLSKRTC